MAKDKDTLTKAYMARPDVFADVFNFFIYNGRQVIKAEQLRDMDTTTIALPFGLDGTQAPVQKIRDVLKQWIVKRDDKAAYLLLGVENQSDIHYAMPVRNMLYDALQYSAQVDTTAKAHKKAKREDKPTLGEYLSGFYKSDRLIPVVTLVVYFGAKHWDGPMSLHEMMTVQDEDILKYVTDYRINLVAPEAMTMEDADKLCTDLKEVMLFVKYSEDKDKLSDILERDEKFKAIARDTAEVIKAVTGTDMTINESEESVNMCKAIQDIRLEGIEQGIAQGIEKGVAQGVEQGVEKTIVMTIHILRSMGMSDEEIVDKIVKNSNISEEDAERYVYGE